MPSSTFSFDGGAMTHSRWLLTWILAAVVTLGGWFGFEVLWRGRGYVPTVMDSMDLWSLNRSRAVKASPAVAVAMLGASRIQYGLSPSVFRDEARATLPFMLAINGRYPLATLRDLAEDISFKGIAIVGVDARGMDKRVWEMQANYVRQYHHDWSPAREVHRRLLTLVQREAIAARPDFAWVTLVKRWVNGNGPPYREYVTFERDRSGGTDYRKSAVAEIRNARVAELKNYYRDNLPPTPAEWLNEMRTVVRWVEKINSRGGKVVFYREPVSGEHIEQDEAKFPRPLYWDKLVEIMPALMIDFRDYPELNIDTPDTSHIDIKDIDRHTRALVRVLKLKGIL